MTHLDFVEREINRITHRLLNELEEETTEELHNVLPFLNAEAGKK